MSDDTIQPHAAPHRRPQAAVLLAGLLPDYARDSGGMTETERGA